MSPKRVLYDSPECYPPNKRFLSERPDIKPGTLLTDIVGQRWRLGKPVGTGAFGEIFLASNLDDPTRANEKYVAKVESHKSGPLFVEINCYLRIAKFDMVNSWKSENNVPNLGMPHYVTSGSYSAGNSRFRFLVIPHYDQDLETVFQLKKCKFNLKTVLTISMQLLDILQYIHDKGYVHLDIKASNILFNSAPKKPRGPGAQGSPKTALHYHGCTPMRTCKVKMLRLPRTLRPNENSRSLNADDKSATSDGVYLLDYGLAAKYVTSDGYHKSCDARKAHVGTIMFCSLDAHQGAHSRRSDLESLGYNMVYWLTSFLPWCEDTDNPELVQRKKCKCIENLSKFLSLCFDNDYPRFLLDYFSYLKGLKFEDKPDYGYCKSIFKVALLHYGYKDNDQFDFDNLEGWGPKQKRMRPPNSENLKCQRVVAKNRGVKRLPLTSNIRLSSMCNSLVKPNLRKQTKEDRKAKRMLNWSKILMDPNMIMKKSRERKTTDTSENGGNHSNGILNLDLNELNPTYAMLDVYNRTLDRLSSGNGVSPKHRSDFGQETIEGYTSAMLAVHNRRKEREEAEHANSKLNNYSNKRSKSRVKVGKNSPQQCIRSPVQTRCRSRNLRFAATSTTHDMKINRHSRRNAG